MGLEALAQFVERRSPLEVAFGGERELVYRLAAASGGSLRDLVRLMRDCLMSVDTLPIDGNVVKAAIRRGVRGYRQLPFIDDYLPELRSMLETGAMRFPRTEGHYSKLYSLLRDQVLLRYHNDDYWEAPHPMVLPDLDLQRFWRLVYGGAEE